MCLPYLEGLLPEDIQPFEAASANYGFERADGFTFINGRTHETMGTMLLLHEAGANRGMFVGCN